MSKFQVAPLPKWTINRMILRFIRKYLLYFLNKRYKQICGKEKQGNPRNPPYARINLIGPSGVQPLPERALSWHSTTKSLGPNIRAELVSGASSLHKNDSR